MNKRWSRRDIIKTGVAGALAAGAHVESTAGPHPEGGRPPHRVLGKTGVRVPILGYGTAPTGVKQALKDAIALYNEAIDLGVNYLDTAPEFAGYGKAQVQLGHVVPGRRKEVFLVTKLWEPDMDRALRLLEQNLKEMRVDHADLVYAHSIGSDKMDLDVVMGEHGTMAALEKARKEGLTRFIGISGHNRPDKFLEVLKRFEIDVMMNAVNIADRYTYDFEGKVWPAAARQKVGLVAMKVFGGMGAPQPLSSSVMPKEELNVACRYALSLPHVACAVIGMAAREELHQNLEWARSFRPLSEQERRQAESTGRRLAAQWGAHFGPV